MKRKRLVVLTVARVEALIEMTPALRKVIDPTKAWRGGKNPRAYREALVNVALAVREGRCLPRRSE